MARAVDGLGKESALECRYVTIDVFTDRMFGGNPLAVVLDAAGLSTSQMQAIAIEFNYSETTFVLGQDRHAEVVPGEYRCTGYETLEAAAVAEPVPSGSGSAPEAQTVMALYAAMG